MTDTFDEPRQPTLRAPPSYDSDAERRDDLVQRIDLQVRMHGGFVAALLHLEVNELDWLLERLRRR